MPIKLFGFQLASSTLEASGKQLSIERDRHGLAFFFLGDQARVFEGAPVMAQQGKAYSEFFGNFRAAHSVAMC